MLTTRLQVVYTLKRLARELGQSKSELYRELQRERARSRSGAR
jgi:IS30 family transposase